MDKTSLIKGSLEMCVLAILMNGKSYGYEIMKELEAYQLELKGDGSIYPILTKLKNKQLVNVTREFADQGGRARVYYEINDKGIEYLQREIRIWMSIQQNIEQLLKEHHTIPKEERIDE